MDQKFVCPEDGRKGGLILFWKKEIKVQRLNLDPMYIDVTVEATNSLVWRLTGMYGEFRWENKYKTWGRMRHFHHAHNLP